MESNQSKKDLQIVRNIADEMLEVCEVKEFPTPIDNLIEFANLKCSEYNPLEKGFWETIKEKETLKERAKLVFHKIKAILIPRKRQIWIDRFIHPAKEPFAKLHELGHFKIDWHRKILYACSEHDLDYRIRRMMEREANIFASEALFQGNKFTEIAEQFPLHMNTVLQMSNLCGASYESTARRYVETNRHSCALAVLRPLPSIDEFGRKTLEFIYSIYSESFLKQFGNVNFGKHFSPQHLLSRIVNEKTSEDVMEAEVKIKNQVVKVQTFYNSYRVFALFTG